MYVCVICNFNIYSTWFCYFFFNKKRNEVLLFFVVVGFELRSMDSNARESWDAKAEFKKPSNDAANRKYRRRSPVGGSSPSSDGQLI